MYRVHKIETRADLEAAYRVRREVFVDEQRVPEELELDEHDEAPGTIHFLARDGEDKAVGTARLRPYGEAGVAKVERVAVRRALRGSGIGRLLMEAVEAEAARLGFGKLVLYAQTHARGFYEKLGYRAYGEPFDEAGIEHIAMDKPVR